MLNEMKLSIQMWEPFHTQFLEPVGIQWELTQAAAIQLTVQRKSQGTIFLLFRSTHLQCECLESIWKENSL